jgi:hypothetical protein
MSRAEPHDLGGEHRAKSVPPVSNRSVTYLDAALVQEVLIVAQRQREADVEHHCYADDLGAGLEVGERGASGHQKRLAGHPRRLKASSSDNTLAHYAETELAYAIVRFLADEARWLDEGVLGDPPDRVAKDNVRIIVTAVRLGTTFLRETSVRSAMKAMIRAMHNHEGCKRPVDAPKIVDNSDSNAVGGGVRRSSESLVVKSWRQRKVLDIVGFPATHYNISAPTISLRSIKQA